MITAWIIQPQIEKLVEQRKQLDSLRVDMKVETFLIKRKLESKKIEDIKEAFLFTAHAIKAFQNLVYHLNHIGKSYPRGGTNLNDSSPCIKREFKETDLTNNIKKWEQQRHK